MLKDALYTTVGPGTAMMGLRPEQHPVWPSSNVMGLVLLTESLHLTINLEYIDPIFRYPRSSEQR